MFAGLDQRRKNRREPVCLGMFIWPMGVPLRTKTREKFGISVSLKDYDFSPNLLYVKKCSNSTTDFKFEPFFAIPVDASKILLTKSDQK
jgi:hypothetical protein